MCGGDGTVRSAIEGLVGTDAALAVLPGGTGNLLATNLDVPTNVPDGVDTALRRGRRAIDVGDVEGQSFAVMAGMGLDAAMVDDAPTAAQDRARLRRLRVLRAQARVRPRDARRGRRRRRAPARRHARTVLVGNVGRLQGGVNVLPDAEADSGELEVAIVAPRNLGALVPDRLVGVLRGRKRLPRVEYQRGEHVVVRAASHSPGSSTAT